MIPDARLLLRMPDTPAEEEKRRYHRIPVSLPVEYVAFHPESGESYYGQGRLRNFSLGGAFFQVPESPPMAPGHRVTLKIILPLPPLSEHDPGHIHARGEVVRLEDPHPEDGLYGIAVCFHKLPSFNPFTSS